MRKLSIAIMLLLTSPLFMATTCHKDRSCDQAICTMIFASVTVQVVDAGSQSVQLDEVYTIRKRTGEKISLDQHMTEGRYNVLDDSYRKNIQNSTEEFEFVGIKGGQQVVSAQYWIEADCCHVSRAKGPEKITL